MDGLANAVFDNLVFLQICVPLVGSLLVVVVSGGGLPVVRRTACSNTFISLVLTGLMVAHYDPPDEIGVTSGTTQMVSILPWVSPQFPKSTPTTDDDASIDVDRVSASGARFSVGVDGLSLIFIAIASLTSFAAVWTSPQRSTRTAGRFLWIAAVGAVVDLWCVRSARCHSVLLLLADVDRTDVFPDRLVGEARSEQSRIAVRGRAFCRKRIDFRRFDIAFASVCMDEIC